MAAARDYREAITRGINLYGTNPPPAIIITNRDPVFAGYHSFVESNDRRSYSTTPHTCYPWHLNGPANRRLITIFLPIPETIDTVVHELAHALDYWTGFTIDAPPVTQYAQRNRREAFAEAVTAALIPTYAPWAEPNEQINALLRQWGAR